MGGSHLHEDHHEERVACDTHRGLQWAAKGDLVLHRLLDGGEDGPDRDRERPHRLEHHSLEVWLVP